MRRLGIDPGRKRIGLARSDEGGTIALPLHTVQYTADGAQAIEAIVAEIERQDTEEIVIGLPLRLDGSEGDAARRARAFGARLEKRLGTRPIVFWDERMTSVLAERALRDIGVRSRSLRDVVDSSAATLILQSYIDARTERPWPNEEHLVADPGAAGADANPRGARGRRRRKR